MRVLATLGDAPTAAIAVVAIALGLFLAARGPRDKRAAGAADGAGAPGPAMVTLPVASAPEDEPGFVGPQGEVVGHGPIRLGLHGQEPPPSEPPVEEPPAAPEHKDPAWRVAARAATSAAHFRPGSIKRGGKRKDH